MALSKKIGLCALREAEARAPGSRILAREY
jgi:hypothetical protein